MHDDGVKVGVPAHCIRAVHPPWGVTMKTPGSERILREGLSVGYFYSHTHSPVLTCPFLFRLKETYRIGKKGSMSKQSVYQDYLELCAQNKAPVHFSPTVFGKLVKRAFPTIRTNKKGPRGDSKQHYTHLSRIKNKHKNLTAQTSHINCGPPCHTPCNTPFNTAASLYRREDRVNGGQLSTEGEENNTTGFLSATLAAFTQTNPNKPEEQSTNSCNHNGKCFAIIGVLSFFFQKCFQFIIEHKVAHVLNCFPFFIQAEFQKKGSTSPVPTVLRHQGYSEPKENSSWLPCSWANRAIACETKPPGQTIAHDGHYHHQQQYHPHQPQHQPQRHSISHLHIPSSFTNSIHTPLQRPQQLQTQLQANGPYFHDIACGQQSVEEPFDFLCEPTWMGHISHGPTVRNVKRSSLP